MNFNRVILGGNLTRDPQTQVLPSNTPICEFGLAINRKWTSQGGDKKEEVCFVDCKAFGKTAELIGQHMAKGSPILVEGRLNYESWEGKDGKKKSRLTVVVDSFQFVGSKGGGQDRPSGAPVVTNADADPNEIPF